MEISCEKLRGFVVDEKWRLLVQSYIHRFPQLSKYYRKIAASWNPNLNFPAKNDWRKIQFTRALYCKKVLHHTNFQSNNFHMNVFFLLFLILLDHSGAMLWELSAMKLNYWEINIEFEMETSGTFSIYFRFPHTLQENPENSSQKIFKTMEKIWQIINQKSFVSAKTLPHSFA
jgi:hypothetical protein